MKFKFYRSILTEMTQKCKCTCCKEDNNVYELNTYNKDDAKDNIDEMKEEGIRGKILSITGLERKGIDPNDDKNWTSGPR